MLIVNPKRENETIEVKPYWYQYYAGYSHTFTQKILESVELTHSSVILDPWNGGGTTTLMASANGFRSIGVDLNPVMKVIALAKQAVKSDIETINKKLIKINARGKSINIKNDPLLTWFDFPSVKHIRKIENFILEGSTHESTLEKVDSLTNAQCLMYTGLFNCVRAHLDSFIPSNPTWVKKPKAEEKKISISWTAIKNQYISHVQDMVNGIDIADHQWHKDTANIIIGSSTNLPIKSSSVDFILTSPPYCTRIDYGIATLPELSILCTNGENEIDLIRRQLMGTTTVPKEINLSVNKLTEKCICFLEAVKSHSSKASKSYYYKNLAQYFISLNLSIKEIERVLVKNSKFICVVQDSFYKNIHCDLPEIISEMAESRGLRLREKIEFEIKKNMVNLNTKSKQYRSKSTAFESVLIFEKGEKNEQ